MASRHDPLSELGAVNADLRDFAMRAGDLHGAYLEAFNSAYEAVKTDDAAFGRDMTSRLVSLDCIGRDEKGILDRILDAILDPKKSAPDTQSEVEDLTKRLHADLKSSPTAVAIAGIAQDSIRTAAKEKGGGKGGAEADVMGALGGAVAGSKGGFWGVLVVGVVAGVAASWAAKRDDAAKKKAE